MNDVIHCFFGRHNQLPHDRKDSNNLRHADRNLAQNEVSRAHQITFQLQLIFDWICPQQQTSIVMIFFWLVFLVNAVKCAISRVKSTKEYTNSLLSTNFQIEYTPYKWVAFKLRFLTWFLHLENVDYERLSAPLFPFICNDSPISQMALPLIDWHVFFLSQLALIKIGWEVRTHKKRFLRIREDLIAKFHQKPKCTHFKREL